MRYNYVNSRVFARRRQLAVSAQIIYTGTHCMKQLSLDDFTALIAQAKLKPRLKAELRFVASTVGMSVEDWHNTEFLAVTTRSAAKGVVLLSPGETIYVLPFELTKSLVDKRTGRAQPIICDFCRSWQPGSNAGSITFYKDKQSMNSVTFLCCADLQCSKHVRGLTVASKLSRAQLREDLTSEQRVERLKERLQQIAIDLDL